MRDAERAIERQLTTPVSASFDEVPLSRVLDEIRSIKDINIDVDTMALQDEGISSESKISIHLESVTLKSALKQVLRQVRLTYVIKDDTLLITTEEEVRGKPRTVMYGVADLVLEGLPVLRSPTLSRWELINNPFFNFRAAFDLVSQLRDYGGLVNNDFAGLPVAPNLPRSSESANADQATTEKELIRLITCSIKPKSWVELGGRGTIAYVPQTLSLVINQPRDVHELIQALLSSLREAQDAKQVRSILLAPQPRGN